MPIWLRTKDENAPITVPEKVRNRARKALFMGAPSVWIDQALYLIGSNVTHHKRGDPLLNEAVLAAETLLAFLVEMRERENDGSNT